MFKQSSFVIAALLGHVSAKQIRQQSVAGLDAENTHRETIAPAQMNGAVQQFASDAVYGLAQQKWERSQNNGFINENMGDAPYGKEQNPHYPEYNPLNKKFQESNYTQIASKDTTIAPTKMNNNVYAFSKDSTQFMAQKNSNAAQPSEEAMKIVQDLQNQWRTTTQSIDNTRTDQAPASNGSGPNGWGRGYAYPITPEYAQKSAQSNEDVSNMLDHLNENNKSEAEISQAPAQNGSGPKGWGNGLTAKQNKPIQPEYAQQMDVRGGGPMYDPYVAGFVSDNVEPMPYDRDGLKPWQFRGEKRPGHPQYSQHKDISPSHQSRQVYDFLHDHETAGIPPVAEDRPETYVPNMYSDAYDTTKFAQKDEKKKDVSPVAQSRIVYDFLHDHDHAGIKPVPEARPDAVPVGMWDEDYKHVAPTPAPVATKVEAAPTPAPFVAGELGGMFSQKEKKDVSPKGQSRIVYDYLHDRIEPTAWPRPEHVPVGMWDEDYKTEKPIPAPVAKKVEAAPTPAPFVAGELGGMFAQKDKKDISPKGQSRIVYDFLHDHDHAGIKPVPETRPNTAPVGMWDEDYKTEAPTPAPVAPVAPKVVAAPTPAPFVAGELGGMFAQKDVQKRDVSPSHQSRQVYDFLHDHDHAGIKPVPETRPEAVPKTMFQGYYDTTAYTQQQSSHKDVSPDGQSRQVYDFLHDNVKPTAWGRPETVPKTMFQDYYDTTAYAQKQAQNKDISPNNIEAGVHGAVSGMIDPLPEPRDGLMAWQWNKDIETPHAWSNSAYANHAQMEKKDVSPDHQSRSLYEYLHERGVPPMAESRPDLYVPTMYSDAYNTTAYAQKDELKKDISPSHQSRQVYDFLHDHDHASIKPVPESRPETAPVGMWDEDYKTTAYAQKDEQKKDISPEKQSRIVYDFLHDHDHASIKPIPESRTEDVPTTMFGDSYNTTAYAQIQGPGNDGYQYMRNDNSTKIMFQDYYNTTQYAQMIKQQGELIGLNAQ